MSFDRALRPPTAHRPSIDTGTVLSEDDDGTFTVMFDDGEVASGILKSMMRKPLGSWVRGMMFGRRSPPRLIRVPFLG